MLSFLAEDLAILNTIVSVVGVALIVGIGIFLVVRIVNVVKEAKASAKIDSEPKYISASDVVEAMDVRDNDFLVMARNVIYSCGEDGQIQSGKYLLKSAISGMDKFNIRYNGLVREFSDGDTVILVSGDTICAVSNPVLIKSQND